MKRIILLVISLLFVMSINVMAVSFLDFDQELYNADLEYGPGEGELEYILTPLLYVDGKKQDVLLHDILLKLGVGESTEIYGNLLSTTYSNNDSSSATAYSIGFKNRNEVDNWKLAVIVEYLATSNSFDGLNIGLLTDYQLSNKMVLYHNLNYMRFEENDSILLINGLSYNVDEKTRFLLKIYTEFINEFEDTVSKFRGCLEYDLHGKIRYTGMISKVLDADNTCIINQLDFELIDRLYLTGNFTYNSSKDIDNIIAVGLEKKFDQLSLKVKYETDLGDYRFSDVSFGLGYSF